MTMQQVSNTTFKACASHSFQADFGVCRGETISRFENLILGDIYLVKPDAKWMTVDPRDDGTHAFSLEIAANLPNEELVTLAHLIFMTTTGRRVDVFATQALGQMYIVTKTPLQKGLEYVLIDIATRDVAFTPNVVSTPESLKQEAVQDVSNVVPLRAIG